jgi:nicotinate-nucleotide pyrophosphorylase (carboxylating)
VHVDDIEAIIERALAEDLPDITSDAIFDAGDRGSARFLVKADGVIAGLRFAQAVFATLDEDSRFRTLMADGSLVRKGDIVAEVDASVRALLSGERTALNLMQRASGIATATRRYADAVAGTAAKIVDTRKTVPGLRALDKYAVGVGGGTNHRIGLFDMFLVKNNHIDRAGGIRQAIEKIRATGRKEPLMIEVRDLDELDQAVATDPDYILLDNMSNEMMAEAVRRVGGRIPLEASGGITLDNVAEVARTGVDRISIGALTHSVVALDISMRVRV